jgi:hypothetical protein
MGGSSFRPDEDVILERPRRVRAPSLQEIRVNLVIDLARVISMRDLNGELWSTHDRVGKILHRSRTLDQAISGSLDSLRQLHQGQVRVIGPSVVEHVSHARLEFTRKRKLVCSMRLKRSRFAFGSAHENETVKHDKCALPRQRLGRAGCTDRAACGQQDESERAGPEAPAITSG